MTVIALLVLSLMVMLPAVAPSPMLPASETKNVVAAVPLVQRDVEDQVVGGDGQRIVGGVQALGDRHREVAGAIVVAAGIDRRGAVGGVIRACSYASREVTSLRKASRWAPPGGLA